MNQELTRSKHKHEYSNAGLYNCPHCQHMFEGEQALQDICANCMGKLADFYNRCKQGYKILICTYFLFDKSEQRRYNIKRQ